MNICLLCRNFYRDSGGTETFTLNYAKALASAGHEVHIVCEDRGKFNRSLCVDRITVHPVEINENPFPGYWKLDKWFSIDDLVFSYKAARKVKELYRLQIIEIVEVMDYFRQGVWLAVSKKVPMFLRLHGWMFNKQDGRTNPIGHLNLKERVQWHFQQKTIKGADGIAAVSGDFADFASEVWHFNGKPVKVIHNAVRAQEYTPGLKQDERPMEVFFAARLAKIKGVKVLADCAQTVLSEFPNTVFIFAGKDLYWEEEEVKASQYLAQKIPAENLKILGELSSQEVLPYYQRCQICVLGSLYEPFGLMALEAMSCGCALVAASSGGLKEIVDHQKDGLLVQPGNPDELASAIIRFLKESELRSSCAKNAIRKARDVFHYDNLVNASIDGYKQALESYLN